MHLSTVVLAAGQGVRMRSHLPKVLHPVGGRPMLLHVLETARALNPAQTIVIYGYEGAQVRAAVSDPEVLWVEQNEPKGTGDAVAKALPSIPQGHRVLVLFGDVPLISAETLERFIAQTPEDSMGIITLTHPRPAGLGRIIRDAKGQITGIVEHKDATPTELAIQEVNTGIFLVPQPCLQDWLPTLRSDNAQSEFYFTDIVKMAFEAKVPIVSVQPGDLMEVQGVNDRAQWTQVERAYQKQQAYRWIREGVQIIDPARFDVRGELQVAKNAFIDIDVICEGRVDIGQDTHIGPFCTLKNCKIGSGVTVKAYSHLEDVELKDNCSIGPYARLRPGTVIEEGARIGNFVEVKKSHIGKASKVNHLSYVGDATLGEGVNVGAGTIFCNYDGVNKHHTTVEDNVFIGSGSEIVAPRILGKGATIGAGTTLTKDAPAGQLTLRRGTQQQVPGWKRPKKTKKND